MRTEQWGTLFFFLAVLHTFAAPLFRRASHRFDQDGARAGLLHWLGEVEIVFGFWAAIFFGVMALLEGVEPTVRFLDSVSFTEPLFVFAIMALCSTKPLLEGAGAAIRVLSQIFHRGLRVPRVAAEVWCTLTFGSLLGSVITEPAAMTVTALLLLAMIRAPAPRVLYALLGVLFVNVSVGGALTAYAAPPILMVAKAWGWDTATVFAALGWKVVLIVPLNSLLFVFIFRRELARDFAVLPPRENRAPALLTLLHAVFLAGLVVFSHHEKVFMAIFLFFLGVVSITRRHQHALRLRESLLVAFFLGGIIVFGPFQTWWLKPLVASLGGGTLFLGSTLLTSVTDNAALTYLGSQVENLSELSRYALVAGALAGGGLTVIANAPNPAGYALMQRKFPDGQVSALGLLAGATVPTLIAVSALWFL